MSSDFQPDAPPAQQLSLAVQRLRAGGLVAFPTETVYGLGADAFNPAAVERVFATKGRPAHNPLIVHVDGAPMAAGLVAQWPAQAARLAEAFWPGPLTLVLPASDRVPALVRAGGPNVALRCPNHPVAIALLRAFGGPLVGPSANPSGSVSPTTAQHVRDAFDEQRVLVLDGGPCTAGIESTVLSLAQSPPRVLRPGPISPSALARVLGEPVLEALASPTPGPGPLDSPGLLARHYAPRTRAVLVPNAAALATLLASMERAGQHAAVVGAPGEVVAPPHAVLPMPTQASAYARELYATLRRADALAADAIVIVAPPAAHADPGGAEHALWQAVLDRLRRATTPA